MNVETSGTGTGNKSVTAMRDGKSLSVAKACTQAISDETYMANSGRIFKYLSTLCQAASFFVV